MPKMSIKGALFNKLQKDYLTCEMTQMGLKNVGQIDRCIHKCICHSSKYIRGQGF